jgi:hypothetical protein
VEFLPEGKPSWIGNFQPGVSAYNSVVSILKGTLMLVIAGGHAYLIETDTRTLVKTFGGAINTILPAPGVSLLILGNGVWLEAWKGTEMQWRTRRISWDGIKDLKIEGESITRLAWSPFGDRWVGFSIDLKTGRAEGGSYREAPKIHETE